MKLKINYNPEDKDTFYPEVRKRVDSYFKENHLTKNANGLMWAKVAFIIGLYISTYLFLVLSGAPVLILWIMALIHGFSTALVGLNITHDAIHGSLSSNKTLNTIFSHLMNVTGASEYLWRLKHNRIHHSFTNIHGHDEDLNQPDVMRLCPHQNRKWIHRFQHIYMFLLYPMASISWIFVKDYKNMSRKSYGFYEPTPPSTKVWVVFFGYKILYVLLFILLPFYLIQIPLWQFLIGFITAHLIEGITLALVFQLAHLVEGLEFPLPDNNQELSKSWAIHQMYTTANFGCDSKITHFLTGGLNFQVEHHLFPMVCHIHYPAISKIVKQTAKEYGLPYHENKSMLSALGSHYRHMKLMGRLPSMPIME
jgi:linoleoyl-CoA desaturase